MENDGSSAGRSAAPAVANTAEANGRRSFARLNPTQLVLIVCVAGAFGWAGFYGLGLLRSSAFNNDRAFRVLTEIVGQIESFQGTMTSMIALIPENVATVCAREAAGQSTAVSRVSANGGQDKATLDCEAVKRNYAAKLRLPDIAVGDVNSSVTPSGSGSESQQTCKRWRAMSKGAKRFELRFSLDDPDHRFVVSNCSVLKEGGTTSSQLNGKLRSSLPFFAAQEFFDQALLTIGDGTVLAAIPSSSRQVATSLQSAPSSDLIIADAGELLRTAVQADIAADMDRPTGEKKNAEAPAGAVPDHPVVFEKTLGGEKYQVYVLPFEPSISWTLANESPVKKADEKSSASADLSTLFVIGIKRENISQQIAYALWPDGAFVMGVFVLLAVLSWPLVRVRFSAALEPVSPALVFASAIALVLIPAVLTVTAVWIWSRLELAYWADTSAERYAGQIEVALNDELRDSIGLLDHYQEWVYRPCAMFDLTSADARDRCVKSKFSKEVTKNADALKSWSPLRTVVVLNKDGESDGPRLSTFDRAGLVPQPVTLKLADREYFKALKRGDAWGQSELITEVPGADSTRLSKRGFVAQRLFNRGDAARALQVAVPREPAKPAKAFNGIVSGDTRAYSLTASVAPPLLRFAVIDRETGAVVFHSRDERSLVENFFVETEQDPALRARLARQDSGRADGPSWLGDHFSGRYVGDPHRFYVRNVDGIPWSIIVFYPTKLLGAVAFEASLTAMTTAIVVVILAIVFIVIALLLRSKGGRARDLVKLIWPRRELCRRYPTIAWGIASLVLLSLTAMAISFGKYGIGTLTLLLTAGSIALTIRFRNRCADRTAATHSESDLCEKHYIGCLFIAAVMIAAIPSLYVGLRFYDLSLQSLIDSGLANAGSQIEKRHRTLADDLARWEQDDNVRASDYPEIWTLSDALLRIPGLCTIESAKTESRWMFTALSGIPYASANGPPAYESLLQRIWTARTEAGAPGRGPWRVRAIVPAQENSPACTNRTLPSLRVEAFHVHTYQGQALSLSVPYQSPDITNDPAAIAVRILFTGILGVATLVCINLLAIVIARRLCGSRSIFTIETWEGATQPLLREQIPARWYALSRADKVFLYELTHEHIVKPANPESLDELVKQGFVRFDPWPQLADENVRKHVESADLSVELRNVEQSREVGSWKWLRVPLLITLVALLGLFAWLAGSSMQLVTTIFAGIATLLGYLGKAQAFVRGDK